MLKYIEMRPSLADYKRLFESTGWTASIEISDGTLQQAIDNSWHWISVFENDVLIGVGRIVSDGGLYAFVCDMIVHPDYQNQGIGTSILAVLKDKCAKHNIQRVWLFSAPGRAPFYEKNGFAIRPENAPGMQMITN
jgi:GNAT superfamily N-acetyltransferase